MLKQKEDERRKFIDNEISNNLKYEELKNKYDDVAAQSKDYDKQVRNKEDDANNYVQMKLQTANVKEDLIM